MYNFAKRNPNSGIYIFHSLKKYADVSYNIKPSDNFDTLLCCSKLYPTSILKIKIPKVLWIFDLLWETPREYLCQVFARDFDLILTTDGGHQKEWQNIGANHRVLRQGIYDEYAFIGKKHPQYECDVCFIGNNIVWYPPRQKLIAKLQRKFKNRFKRWGEENSIFGRKLNDVIASSKIIVGDTVYSPYYWSNRIYEVLGRGGFLIHPYVPGIEEEYIPYKHFIPYEAGNFEMLKDLINFYLKKNSIRDKIRKSAFEWTKKYHLYSHRCQRLIKLLKAFK